MQENRKNRRYISLIWHIRPMGKQNIITNVELCIEILGLYLKWIGISLVTMKGQDMHQVSNVQIHSNVSYLKLSGKNNTHDAYPRLWCDLTSTITKAEAIYWSRISQPDIISLEICDWKNRRKQHKLGLKILKTSKWYYYPLYS